jgi:hypothetical protein
MKAKYIITQDNQAIVFAPEIEHSHFKHFHPIAAGFVKINPCLPDENGNEVQCNCSGESESLGIKSRGEEDEEIINVQILNSL